MPGLLLLTACSDSPSRPGPQLTEPVEIHVSVNVQLQQAPAGEQPFYIVTGTAAAEQGGVARATTIDSTVVDYSHNAGEWTRLRRTTAIPFSDVLPFTASPGDVYRVRARMYASAFDDEGTRHSASAEWVASAAVD